MLYRWRNKTTNRVYKGYSRFRHIKKRRSWESTCMTLGTPFPLGMECFMRSVGIWKWQRRFLRWPANQHTVAWHLTPKTAAGCNKNPAYARHTLPDAKTNSYQCISSKNGRCTPIAAFCFQPRAPPLLKFWFSQNFKRMEESVWDSTVQQRKQNLIVNGQNCEKNTPTQEWAKKAFKKYTGMSPREFRNINT